MDKPKITLADVQSVADDHFSDNPDSLHWRGSFTAQMARALLASQEALRELLLFFESGNSIPVEAAHIRGDSEWVAKARAALLEAE